MPARMRNKSATVISTLLILAVPVASRSDVAFAPPPSHDVPADAAFHRRAAKPEAGLHLMTQHIHNDISEGNKHSFGKFESGRHHYDLQMDFHIGLHPDLASLDDIPVSHFEHGDEFHSHEHHPRLVVGAVLMGTHHGNWSFTPGSSHALLKDKDDTHKFGGFSYMRRVVAVDTLQSGKVQVKTTPDVDRNVLLKGRAGLAWNHTKMEMKPRTTAIDEGAFSQLDGGRKLAYTTNPGVCDESEDECSELSPDSLAYDRIGGCGVYSYVSGWTGCSDEDDTNWQQSDGTLGGPTSDDSELCAYCFEYVKTVEAFNFNYDTVAGGAEESTYYPVESLEEVTCVDCWAYVGATVFYVVNWEGLDLGSMEAGVSGMMGFNFDFNIASFSQIDELSDTKTLFTIEECITPITLFQFITITPDCSLDFEYVIKDTVFDGSLQATAAFAYSLEAGVKYEDGSITNTYEESLTWEEPAFTYSFNSGEVNFEFVVKPTVVLTVSVGFAGIVTLDGTASVAPLTPGIDVTIETESDRRRLQPQEQWGNLVPGDPLVVGQAVMMEVHSDRDVDHVVFTMHAECWGGLYLPLQDSFVPSGRSNVTLTLPWHALLTGTQCEKYTISARSGHGDFALQSEPFAMTIPNSCQRAVVSSPADGEVLMTDQEYTFRWDPAQLFFYSGAGRMHEGVVTAADRVQISVVGTRILPLGEHCEYGHHVFQEGNNVNDLCVETTPITPQEGTSNDGSFTFDFSAAVTGHGGHLLWNNTWGGRYEHLHAKVTVQGDSITSAVSSGHFFFDGTKGQEHACSDTMATTTTVVPPEGISLSPTGRGTEQNTLGDGTSDTRRRLGDSGVMTTTGNLGGELNFDSVGLYTVFTDTITLWEDNDDEPTASITWLDDFAIDTDVEVWTDSDDTVSVSASMTLQGLDADSVTDDVLDAIKTGLAATIDGVSASHISDVEVVDASTRRRQLLGTTATVSFTVSLSLSETDFTSADDLSSTVSTTLSDAESDSTTLLDNIKAADTSSTVWDSVTGVADTSSEINDSGSSSDDDDGGGDSGGAMGAGIGGGAFVVIGLAAAGGMYWRKHKREQGPGGSKAVDATAVEGAPPVTTTQVEVEEKTWGTMLWGGSPSNDLESKSAPVATPVEGEPPVKTTKTTTTTTTTTTTVEVTWSEYLFGAAEPAATASGEEEMTNVGDTAGSKRGASVDI